MARSSPPAKSVSFSKQTMTGREPPRSRDPCRASWALLIRQVRTDFRKKRASHWSRGLPKHSGKQGTHACEGSAISGSHAELSRSPHWGRGFPKALSPVLSPIVQRTPSARSNCYCALLDRWDLQRQGDKYL